jgi:hypothetical protein
MTQLSYQSTSTVLPIIRHINHLQPISISAPITHTLHQHHTSPVQMKLNVRLHMHISLTQLCTIAVRLIRTTSLAILLILIFALSVYYYYYCDNSLFRFIPFNSLFVFYTIGRQDSPSVLTNIATMSGIRPITRLHTYAALVQH